MIEFLRRLFGREAQPPEPAPPSAPMKYPCDACEDPLWCEQCGRCWIRFDERMEEIRWREERIAHWFENSTNHRERRHAFTTTVRKETVMEALLADLKAVVTLILLALVVTIVLVDIYGGSE